MIVEIRRTGRARQTAAQHRIDHVPGGRLASTAGYRDDATRECAALPIGRALQGLQSVIDFTPSALPAPRCQAYRRSLPRPRVEGVRSIVISVLMLATQRQKNIAGVNLATVDAYVIQTQRRAIDVRIGACALGVENLLKFSNTQSGHITACGSESFQALARFHSSTRVDSYSQCRATSRSSKYNRSSPIC